MVASSSTIDSLDVFHVRVPLPEPIKALGSVIRSRDFIFARAQAGGKTGTGFGLARQAGIDRMIRQHIAPRVVGKPASAIRQIWTESRDSVRMIGEQGIFARALAVVDIALWDLLGSLLDTPLWCLLGGASPQVPCLAITGYYREDDPVGAVRREAEKLVAAGYQKFKLPFGAGAELDMKRLSVIREVVGQDALVAVDASAAFETIKAALDAWRPVENLNIAFLEDPFPESKWELAIRFAQTTDIKIAFGESMSSPAIIQRLGADDGVDVLRPDATHQMGITGYLQGIAPALENRTPIFPHYFPDIHAPLVGALGAPGGLMVEESPVECDTVGFRQLRATQPDIRDGIWHLTEKPGLGIEWDEDALKRFRLLDS
jgi:L-alanine-DL-glutamate epimerase-like enolase superfamily enzyme